MGGFQNWPTRVKRGFVAKNNKETYIYIYFKGGSFRAAHVEKVESLGVAKAKNWELSGAYTRAVLGLKSPEIHNVKPLWYGVSVQIAYK